jgi:hypothetical protein
VSELRPFVERRRERPSVIIREWAVVFVLSVIAFVVTTCSYVLLGKFDGFFNIVSESPVRMETSIKQGRSGLEWRIVITQPPGESDGGTIQRAGNFADEAQRKLNEE